MQNERSTKRGARKQRVKVGDRDVLSGAQLDRGELFKRYVRAAAALAGIFDDTPAQKGRDDAGSAGVMGFVLGPIGLVMAATAKPPAPGTTGRLCVHCGKTVAADRERLCNHCGEPFAT